MNLFIVCACIQDFYCCRCCHRSCCCCRYCQRMMKTFANVNIRAPYTHISRATAGTNTHKKSAEWRAVCYGINGDDFSDTWKIQLIVCALWTMIAASAGPSSRSTFKVHLYLFYFAALAAYAAVVDSSRGAPAVGLPKWTTNSISCISITISFVNNSNYVRLMHTAHILGAWRYAKNAQMHMHIWVQSVW